MGCLISALRLTKMYTVRSRYMHFVSMWGSTSLDEKIENANLDLLGHTSSPSSVVGVAEISLVGDHTFVLSLLERVYTYLVASRHVVVGFPRSSTKQRRIATAFLTDPFYDGWNIVSTAQLLALRLLPVPKGGCAGSWSWEYRMGLAACLLISGSFHHDDGFASVRMSAIRVGMCFMTAEEQGEIRAHGSHGSEKVHSNIMDAEVCILKRAPVFSLATRGPIPRVELELSELMRKGFLQSSREAMVCRNLCVFQMRTVFRNNTRLLHEAERLPLALIAVSLAWMGIPADEVETGVLRVAEDVLVCLSLTSREDLFVGGFADCHGAVGKFVFKSVFELLKSGRPAKAFE